MKSENTALESLQRRDAQCVWHPFSQHGIQHEVLPVCSANGASLVLEDGRRILDGISSWWVNIHGHCHPDLADAISKQARELDHVIFAGFTHSPAIELAETLLEYPAFRSAGLSRVFFSDNGSTAVEAALKMAYQTFVNSGKVGRQKFLALRDSYHGDTLGAMAVGEPEGYHAPFRKLLPTVDFVQAGEIDQLRRRVEGNPDEYAAFIFEPLVQGAGGMKMYDADFLSEAVQLCKKYGIITICDEIFTGFYRTGKCFAFEHSKFSPDIVCLSKGLTGGVLPLSLTLTNEDIFNSFLDKDIRKAFLHGHSYTANPISCAAALASWKLLHSLQCQAQIKLISEKTQSHLEKLRHHPKVDKVRMLGTIGVLEVNSVGNYFSTNSKAWMAAAIEKGVLLRPLGNVLYTLPPYCTTADEMDRIYEVIGQLLDEGVTG